MLVREVSAFLRSRELRLTNTALGDFRYLPLDGSRRSHLVLAPPFCASIVTVIAVAQLAWRPHRDARPPMAPHSRRPVVASHVTASYPHKHTHTHTKRS